MFIKSFIISLLILGNLSYSQNKAGVYVGANYTELSSFNNKVSQYKPLIGFEAGFHYDLTLKNSIGLKPIISVNHEITSG